MAENTPSYIRGPLLYDEVNQEPYLPLPPPHSHIRLTPPRPTDVDAIVSILNDRRIYFHLQGPPFPYEPEHARFWLELIGKGCDNVIAELSALPPPREGEDDEFVLSGCPVRILRERKENGEDVYLGDCGIDRNGFPMEVDLEVRKRNARENEEKPVGDPSIIWSFGGEFQTSRRSECQMHLRSNSFMTDYLNPSYQGQGIMTAAVRTVIEKWAVPHMNAHRIQAEVFTGNIGSQRVFEKNGFKVFLSLPNMVDLTYKDCGIKGLTALEWKKAEA